MRSLGIRDFAENLGISRDTAKNLFRRQVFPGDWLTKSKGGHWRVEIDENGTQLQTARKLYQRWKLFSRKPDASKSLPSPDALGELAMTLIEIRLLGEPLSVKNYGEWKKVILSPEGLAKISEFTDKFRLVESSEHDQAVLLVMQKLWEIKDRWGMEYEPRPSAIARAMNMSIASLYRKPFGKSVIEAARYRLQTCLQGSVNEVHCLSQSFEGEITASVLQTHLLISKEKAERLFEEWEATFSEIEQPHHSENLATRDWGFEGTSKQTDRQKASEFQKEAKRKRDNLRNVLKRQFMVQWKPAKTQNGRWLFLEAVPRYEFEEIQKARSGQITRTNVESLRARIGSQKKNLGCVWEYRGVLLSKGLHGLPPKEAPCESFEEGIDRIINSLVAILSGVERFGAVDWEKIRETAPFK